MDRARLFLKRGLLALGLLVIPALLFAQGPYSAQIQQALQAFVQQAHTWTATQTFASIVVNGSCTGCGGGGTPAGGDTQIQFNDAGAFGATSGLTYTTYGLNIIDTVESAGFPQLAVTSNNGTGDHTDLPAVTLTNESDQFVLGVEGSGGGADNPANIPSTAMMTNYGVGGVLLNAYGGGPVRVIVGNQLSNEYLRVATTGVIGIGPFPTLSTMDLGITRAAAGVLEVNNGTPGGTAELRVGGLKTTGAAGSKKVVCVDTATGQLYASSTSTDCSN